MLLRILGRLQGGCAAFYARDDPSLWITHADDLPSPDHHFSASNVVGTSLISHHYLNSPMAGTSTEYLLENGLLIIMRGPRIAALSPSPRKSAEATRYRQANRGMLLNLPAIPATAIFKDQPSSGDRCFSRDDSPHRRLGCLVVYRFFLEFPREFSCHCEKNNGQQDNNCLTDVQIPHQETCNFPLCELEKHRSRFLIRRHLLSSIK